MSDDDDDHDGDDDDDDDDGQDQDQDDDDYNQRFCWWTHEILSAQELPWWNWEGATAALLPNIQPGLFLNPLKTLAPGLYSKDIVSSPSYLAFFHGINLKYLQIVAGRFPLNKELAFELAALMAQVDHLIINPIITTTTTTAINIIITTIIALYHHLIHHHHPIHYRLTWATLVLNVVAVRQWETQIFRKPFRVSTQFVTWLR